MNDDYQERRARAEGAAVLAGRRSSADRRAERGSNSLDNLLAGAAMAVVGIVITLMI